MRETYHFWSIRALMQVRGTANNRLKTGHMPKPRPTSPRCRLDDVWEMSPAAHRLSGERRDTATKDSAGDQPEPRVRAGETSTGCSRPTSRRCPLNDAWDISPAAHRLSGERRDKVDKGQHGRPARAAPDPPPGRALWRCRSPFNRRSGLRNRASTTDGAERPPRVGRGPLYRAPGQGDVGCRSTVLWGFGIKRRPQAARNALPGRPRPSVPGARQRRCGPANATFASLRQGLMNGKPAAATH